VTQYTSAKSDEDFGEKQRCLIFCGVNKERINTIISQDRTFIFVKKKEIWNHLIYPTKIKTGERKYLSRPKFR
jgi:hypothetical protein